MKTNFILLSVLILALTSCAGEKKPVTPENALENYINNNDKTYSWEI